MYKRQSAVLVPADAEGLTVESVSEDSEFCRVHFEDVEIEGHCIIGNIGFGKLYFDHFSNVSNLLTATVQMTILEKYLEKFIQDSKIMKLNGIQWAEESTQF